MLGSGHPAEPPEGSRQFSCPAICRPMNNPLQRLAASLCCFCMWEKAEVAKVTCLNVLLLQWTDVWVWSLARFKRVQTLIARWLFFGMFADIWVWKRRSWLFDLSTVEFYPQTHHLAGRCLYGNKIEEKKRIVRNKRSDVMSLALRGTKNETHRLFQEKENKPLSKADDTWTQLRAKISSIIYVQFRQEEQKRPIEQMACAPLTCRNNYVITTILEFWILFCN